MKCAKWLEACKDIDSVRYPALKSHPNHLNALMNRSSEKWSGGSGMIAFYMKGDLDKAKKFCESLKMISLAFSLGDI